jgi:hypothetical protein
MAARAGSILGWYTCMHGATPTMLSPRIPQCNYHLSMCISYQQVVTDQKLARIYNQWHKWPLQKWVMWSGLLWFRYIVIWIWSFIVHHWVWQSVKDWMYRASTSDNNITKSHHTSQSHDAEARQSPHVQILITSSQLISAGFEATACCNAELQAFRQEHRLWVQ